MSRKSIAVVGTGYVGLSLATLLARHHTVVALDIDTFRVDQINHRVSPIRDVNIVDCFKNETITYSD